VTAKLRWEDTFKMEVKELCGCGLMKFGMRSDSSFVNTVMNLRVIPITSN
jgi:hypothetical protein